MDSFSFVFVWQFHKLTGARKEREREEACRHPPAPTSAQGLSWAQSRPAGSWALLTGSAVPIGLPWGLQSLAEHLNPSKKI